MVLMDLLVTISLFELMVISSWAAINTIGTALESI